MKKYIKALNTSQLIMCIYLILVLVGLPLSVNNAYYDIGEAKYYFYCGASLLLVPILLLTLKTRPSILHFFKTLSLGEKALLIYWGASALSTLFSPYRFEAFWGNEGRLSGLFLMSIYAIAYFFISRYYKPHPFFMYAGMLTGAIVFALGITDFFNLNLLHFKDHITYQEKLDFISTMGNINFYASYGAVIVGLTAGIYTTCRKKAEASVWFIFMVFSFVGLVIGNSDSAYLTFGVLAGFMPLYLFQNRRGVRRYFMMISALLLAFLIVKILSIRYSDIVWKLNGIPAIIIRWDGFICLCLIFWTVTAILYGIDYGFHKKDDKLGNKLQILWGVFLCAAVIGITIVLIDANFLGHGDRYSSIRNYVIFNNDWGTHRGFVWRKAIENYKNFPLLQKILGLGPDTYGILSYFRDISESSALFGELFDSVHNEYLQFFVTIGPIATGAYITFLGCSIWDMMKNHCNSYAVGAAFGVFCYCGQALVSINQPGPTSIMWTLLAMGIAEARYHNLV
jgi:hypothetical protein